MTKVNSVKLLLVEDSEFDIKLMEVLLGKAVNLNYELEVATTLKQARHKLEKSNYDLVVLDIALPDGDGMELMQEISSIDSTLPVVILSGDESEVTALKAIRLGAHDYLNKLNTSHWQILRSLNYAIERKKHIQELVYLSRHDLLTGLPNRLLLSDRINRCITRTRRNNKDFALMYLDLDHFKPVNDEYGHEMGDRVLCEVSERLASCIRDSDTVARIGGDEFAVVIEELKSAWNAEIVANKIIKSISEPIRIEETTAKLGVSIGIAIYPSDGSNVDELMSRADSAMYEAKRAGKSTYRFHRQSDYGLLDMEQINQSA